MSIYNSEFYQNNDQALASVKTEVRNMIGPLALKMLESQNDISKMSSLEVMHELGSIIADLHDAYQKL